MITRRHLGILRRYQQKDNYGSKAVEMFNEEGEFNPDNWNGGDSIVRQFFSAFRDYSCYLNQFSKEIVFRWEYGGFEGDIIASHWINNDQNYATVVLDGQILHPVPEGEEIISAHIVTHLSWYKNRGKTEVFKHSGWNHSDETTYLFLLNAIEATGFKFDFNLT